MRGVSELAAFLAGLLSFLSPCILPLIPAYFSYLTGLSLEQLTAEDGSTAARKTAVSHSFAFVLGFTAVFVALGASATAVGQFLLQRADWIARAGGVLLILFGLFLMGFLKIPFLYREARIQIRNKPAGYLGSAAVGAAFAAGWTPCVGPILGAVLALAAGSEFAGRGAWLLFIYSLGLGVPMILSAAALGRFLKFFRRIKGGLRALETAAGAAIALAGILLLTGAFTWVNNVLLARFGGWVRWLGRWGI